MQRGAYLQLESRTQAVREQLQDCRLCPHACGVNRLEGQTGVCGLDERAYCFREMINPTEEPPLLPSHQVYFAGCNLRCGFCSVAEWNESPMRVPVIETDDLVGRINAKRRKGAKNLNLLGGEPTVSLYGILDLLGRLPAETSVVWNSNMYFSEPVRHALDGLVDLYLADYKCDADACSRSLLGVRDYRDVIRGNLLWAADRADLLIRYVILPGHFDCCSRPILEWIAEHVPRASVSLRNDYIPPVPSGNCPAGYVSAAENRKVVDLAKRLDLKVIYSYNG